VPTDAPFPASSARSHLTYPIYKAQTADPCARNRAAGQKMHAVGYYPRGEDGPAQSGRGVKVN